MLSFCLLHVQNYMNRELRATNFVVHAELKIGGANPQTTNKSSAELIGI